MTPNDLMLREALIADHDDILNITKNEKLYDGRDYLPHYLQNWLEQGVDKQSNRRNLVFLLENKIVGFISLYFQNGGSVVAIFGKRITKDLRGRGFGERLADLSIQYAKQSYPLVAASLSCVPDYSLPDSKIYNPKNGQILTKRTFALYQIKFQEMTDLLLKHVAALPEPTNVNQFLTNDEFKQVLQDKAFVSEAFENETLITNLNPALLKTEEDIDLGVMNTHQYILLEGSIQNPIALSVFKFPFPVVDGKIRAMLDFYTCKPDDATGMSAVEHLTKHLVHFNQCNDAVENRVTIFEIFAFQDGLKRVIQDMEKADLGERHFICSTQKRVLQKSYIYKKNLQ